MWSGYRAPRGASQRGGRVILTARGRDSSRRLRDTRQAMSPQNVEIARKTFELRVEPEEFIDAGEEVVIPYRLHTRERSTGIEVGGHETWVFRMRDGKVVRVKEYREKTEALQAAGVRG